MKCYSSAISIWLVIVLALSLGLPLLVTLYQGDWITYNVNLIDYYCFRSLPFS
jgi:hypothetical protein